MLSHGIEDKPELNRPRSGDVLQVIASMVMRMCVQMCGTYVNMDLHAFNQLKESVPSFATTRKHMCVHMWLKAFGCFYDLGECFVGVSILRAYYSGSISGP